MAITISGENNNDRILASDGVIDSLSGFNVVGVITATSFTGDLTGDVTGNLTGNVTGNINNTTLLLQTGGSERVRISSGGDVTIGNSSVAFPSGGGLQVYNASAARIKLANSTTGVASGDGFQIYVSGSSAILDQKENAEMRFYTNATERLRITSSGIVNIGVNASSNPFTYLRFGASQYGAADIRPVDDGSHRVGLAFYVDGTADTTINPTERLRITSGGNVGIATNNPTNKLSVCNGGIKVFGAATPNINFSPVDGNSGNADISFDASDLKIISNSSSANVRIGAYSKLTHFVIKPNGRIGVGTDSPSNSSLLHLYSTTFDPYLRIGSGTRDCGITLHPNSAFNVLRSDAANRLWVNAAADSIRFTVGGDSSTYERLRISSSGQFKVGNDPTAASGTFTHIEAPSGFNSGETIVQIVGDSTTTGPRLNLQNRNTGANASSEILGADSGGQSTTAIRFYHTDQSNNYGEIAFATRNQSGVPPEDRLRISKDGELFVGDGLGSANRSTLLSISGAYQEATGAWAQLGIYSSDSYAQNKGGSLVFGGNAGGGQSRTYFAGIAGVKENSTSGNYAGAMKFYTRPSGSTPVERVRIKSNGNFGIGTDNPVQKLSVFGNMYLRQGDYITWNNGDCEIAGISGYHLRFRTYSGSSMFEHTRMTNDGIVRVGKVTAIAEGNPTEMPRVSSSRGYTSIGRDNASSIIRRFGAYRGAISGMKLFSMGSNGAQTWARVVIGTILGTPSFQVCYQEFLYSGNKNLIDSRYRGNNHTSVVTLAWSGNELQYSCNNSNYYSTIEVELGAPNDSTGNGWYPTWGTSW